MATAMVLDPPNEELIREARNGSAEAFEALLARYGERLQRRIGSLLGPAARARAGADDIYQETVAKALVSVRYFQWKGDESFYRWLSAIAQHVVWNLSKKRSAEALRLDPPDPCDTSASRRVQRLERFERLKQSLDELRPDQREALILVRIEGLSLDEAGRRMGRSPGALQKLVARALLSLRKTFGDTGSLRLPDRSLLDPEESPDA